MRPIPADKQVVDVKILFPRRYMGPQSGTVTFKSMPIKGLEAVIRGNLA
jgi:hypothetical protein